ncbi:MAG: 2-oxoacid:acceptor oxidoreductase family protein [Acidobacteriota bacterium]|jgi:2-oxoglutarate ferredoxin oxidoreductase subunit gamma
MATTEIRISGFGGQGVILAAYVLGKAYAVVEGRHATLNQSFGPEARGSACSAQLILSEEPIMYPYVRGLDILVSMSQDAYHSFIDQVRPGGLVLIDESLVTPRPPDGLRLLGAPATRTAEEIGKRIMANMVMVGLFTAATRLVEPESAEEAIRTSVPSGTQDVNLRAFQSGLEMGRKLMGPRELEEVTA